MRLLTGYLWKTTGEWERLGKGGSIYSQVCDDDIKILDIRFLVYHEDGEGGAYILVADPDAPEARWGTVDEHIPEEARIGCPLEVLGTDGHAGYTVWVVQADGRTNAVTVLMSF